MSQTFVQCSKDILGGIPVFSGTRVPVQNMIDYLEAGDSLDTFLERNWRNWCQAKNTNQRII